MKNNNKNISIFFKVGHHKIYHFLVRKIIFFSQWVLHGLSVPDQCIH